MQFKLYDIVKLKYDKEDLEDEDLGMSGIVLSSPLAEIAKMNYLKEQFVYKGTLMENPIHSFIAVSFGSFGTGKIFMIQNSYLQKVED